MRSFLLLSICTFILSHKIHCSRMPEIRSADSHGKYIIKFKDSPSVVRVSSFIKAQAAHVSPITLASISSVRGIKPEQLKYGISSTYNSTFLNAIAVTLSGEDINKLKKHHGDKIDYIEPDLKFYLSGTQRNATWGLARISQWNRSSSRSYNYPDAAGEGVDVYVLDSGLMTTHPSFGNRAKFVKNCVGGSPNKDFVGHGTHVAGTIGGSKYGVAKKANIYGIKIAADDGNCDLSTVAEGVQFVTQRAKPGKTIINMSLGGPKSRVLDEAVATARKAGVLIVTAAGNSNVDACKISPGSSPHVINVGATDQNDTIAKFPKGGGSNWGKCVDIFAPGVEIVSLGIKEKGFAYSDSGTSMAAPHVAGIAAVYMSIKNYKDPGDVIKDILAKSRKSVKGDVKGSPRRLAYLDTKF